MKIFSYNKLLFFLISFAIIVISFLYFANSSVIIKNIDSVMQSQSQSYTELYMEDHLKLPASERASTPLNFRFTIHNLENKKMSYSYEVYAQIKGAKISIDRGTIGLLHNEYKSITEKYVLPPAFVKAKIVVNLIEKKQQITFLVAEK